MSEKCEKYTSMTMTDRMRDVVMVIVVMIVINGGGTWMRSYISYERNES